MVARILFIVVVAISLTGCASMPRSAGELLSEEYIGEVLRHLYRWHLDETALHGLDQQKAVEIWTRVLSPKLDVGDRSQYVEMVLPKLLLRVTLKKADYDVPELKVRIRNRGFKINQVYLGEDLPASRDNYRVTRLEMRPLLDRLFKTRSKLAHVDDALRERLRVALRVHLKEKAADVKGIQTAYIAPLSPVSNDLWVFWENGRTLIRFSSDADIADKAYWAYEKVGVDVYRLDEDVVVSLAEVPGSNAYVTRDWAARVLFNCVVFGRRLTLDPKAFEVPAEK